MSSTISRGASIIATEPAEPELHIASLVVHTRPEKMAEVKQWLLQQPNVEIHAEDERGKLVVVTEHERAQPILDLIDQAHDLPGVANAALVYHEILTELESQEELEE
ncbi:chaperone NapD [Marinimicrobium sp. ABcell2]|uniref:chaperone NapD n=1 Tax=Marinimicrobium sp. ABcell2 TaxID=3069751 RepID=UPI0027B124BF|nr:chaperone NapD [Marinimicrobium sp. ABcell2]MDQ2076723.1 chaperone NapD [Marinimicrobium sp. ABcell2]